MAAIPGTDEYYAEQEEKNHTPKAKRRYGDPVPNTVTDKEYNDMKVHNSFPSPQHPDGSNADGYIQK